MQLSCVVVDLTRKRTVLLMKYVLRLILFSNAVQYTVRMQHDSWIRIA